MDPFLAEIKMFGGNFAPRAWALCDGQLLSINQNQALFSLLGTTYGGDGRTTFALPDMRGRVAMHAGTGPGLTPRRLGARFGLETNTLNATQMPSHTHTAVGTVQAANVPGNERIPGGFNIAGNGTNEQYSDTATNAAMKANNVVVTVGHTGTGIPINNIEPVLVVNYIICMQGTFPSRN
ncbi:MAG: phage tail protein [Flavobacteriales bacterium]|nr:phage tail protein [Flavobacteriales bacterium]